MYGIGIPEIIIILIILAIVALPVWMVSEILKKAGFNRWFCLISLIPIVNVIFLWVFSFIRWPVETRSNE